MKKCNGTPCTKMNEPGQGKSCAAIDQRVIFELECIRFECEQIFELNKGCHDTYWLPDMVARLASQVKRLANIVEGTLK